MSEIKNKKIFNFILFFSLFALIFAYFVEYFLNHKPCNLCLIERIPYFFTILIIVLCFLFKQYEKICLALLSLTFIIATIISFYHFGIEQGFFKESLVCDLDSKINNLTQEEILKELQKKPISCKNVTFKILGLSLATINTIISFIISSIVTRLFINYEKN